MKFNECKTADEILKYFDNDKCSLGHTHYYHYTSLSTIDKILKTKQIRLTPLSKSANDLIEKEKYEKMNCNLFSLCFSTGTSESLPLWYLYSGIDGCGARMGIKKKSFINFLKDI